MISAGPQLVQDSTPSRDRSFQYVFLVIISVAILLLLVGLGGYSLGKSQASHIPSHQQALAPTISFDPIQPTSSPTPTPHSPTISPQKHTGMICNISDKGFCDFLDDIQPLILSESFSALVTYQNPTEVICDDESVNAQELPKWRSENVCKGILEGGRTVGYYVGYNQGEGGTVTIQEYTTILKGYFSEHKPLNYVGSVVGDDKGYIVYTNSSNKYLFALPVIKSNSSWKILGVTLGLSSTDYNTLDPIILNSVR